MDTFTLMQAVGSMALFSSRAFVTAFVSALLLRFGPDLPLLSGTELLTGIQGAPTWFTHDTTLLVLGVLAALEILATKNPDASALLADVDRYIKPTVAALVTIGVVTTKDAAFVQKALNQAGMVDYTLTLVVVPGVYVLSMARARLLELLRDADEDDDLGIQRLISWAEDVGVIGCLVFLVLFPILMLVLLGIISGVVLLARRQAQVREEKSKIACAGCGQMIYPCAVACPACGVKVAAPRALGALGQSKSKPARNLTTHPFRLVEKKRCPVCATRLTQRAAHQDCPACGHKLLAQPEFANAYLAHVGRRVWKVLGVSVILSLLPVVGLIPGVIYYRVALVAPFRRYIPFGRRIMLKWMVRIFIFILIGIQWIPFVGGLAVPVMAMVNYGAYRSAFRSQLANT